MLGFLTSAVWLRLQKNVSKNTSSKQCLCLQKPHLIFILVAFNSFRVNHDWVKETIFIINILKVKFGLGDGIHSFNRS